MRTILPGALSAVMVFSLACPGCSKRPCEPARATLESQRLGVILDGGRVCSDEEQVLTIDYPRIDDVVALRDLYEANLPERGWTLSPGGSNVMVAEREEASIIIVTMNNRDRGVPTAIIRY